MLQHPQEHLLLISMGPVQDFIASARRCQDLWFGSWLLSDLARTTALELDRAGASVIFPASVANPRKGHDQPGVSNLILARLNATSTPQRAAQQAREAQQQRLRLVADTAWQGLDKDSGFHRDIADQQLAELIEFIWVAVPLGSPDDYATARRLAYRRLAAMKNSRSWSQPSWTDQSGAGVPKSSLDGERECVIDEHVYGHGQGSLSPNQRRVRFGVKGSERLCGIGLLKRLGVDLDDDDERFFRGRRPAFHSTSHVAMTPLLTRIATHPAGPAAAQRYLATLRGLGLKTHHFKLSLPDGAATLDGHDGSLLLSSRLRSHFEQEASDFSDLPRAQQDDVLLRAAEALHSLLRAVDHPGDPCPYYAFLVADGDRMGKAIDGINTLDGHQALGAALDDFALSCARTVQRHGGSLIFAGGDDVLALLPLHTALTCSRALAHDFTARVQPAVTAHWQPSKATTQPPQMSLSVGLGIRHCREAMSQAHALARRAEQLAKRRRDSLAIIVTKRSGADRQVTGQWTEATPLDQRLDSWMTILQDGDLPARAAHDIESVALHFQDLKPAAQHARIDEILSLLRQVLARKQQRGGGGSAVQAAEQALLGFIQGLGPDVAPADSVRALSAELLVARLLQRGHDDLGPQQGVDPLPPKDKA